MPEEKQKSSSQKTKPLSVPKKFSLAQWQTIMDALEDEEVREFLEDVYVYDARRSRYILTRGLSRKEKTILQVLFQEIALPVKEKKKFHISANLDKEIVALLARKRRRGLNIFMTFITRVGDGYVWFGLILFFLFFDLYAGIVLAMAQLIQILLQILIKNIFTRDRPYVKHGDISILLAPPDRFSFPSGHTAGAFTVVFFFWYFYPMWTWPFLVLAVLIGFSRMYLGLHYPTDVVAGMVLGYVSVRIALFLSFFLPL
ncbi:MAG: phosphatase PAP2 family protein [Brevinematales bacterium]|nr:phosphatase PAP2 family protein [Brevinematales bacterium]